MIHGGPRRAAENTFTPFCPRRTRRDAENFLTPFLSTKDTKNIFTPFCPRRTRRGAENTLTPFLSTPEFAVHAIAQWWADPARPRFQREDKILILCDAGGSNNCRSWLWKLALQRQFADRFGIPVLVCHYPTGASKYNPIEYRLFSQITRNWAGKPLRSFEQCATTSAAQPPRLA